MMPFAAYNSNGVRLLCGALADSLEYVRKATGRELSEADLLGDSGRARYSFSRDAPRGAGERVAIRHR